MILSSVPKTLPKDCLKKIREYNLSPWAFSILERWCVNSPDILRELVKKDFDKFINLLLRQEQIESRALSSPSVIEASEKGASDFELLQISGIKTELEDLLF